ncbi:hypothetical protein [Psittacicella hinzii]|uniref:hypothetical protein n=1 Tax=Psittacicella hinzii TaxID=2028575 RepID=UPI001CA79089|nr:hypothetical protein [Psittacicella hinzii]
MSGETVLNKYDTWLQSTGLDFYQTESDEGRSFMSQIIATTSVVEQDLYIAANTPLLK